MKTKECLIGALLFLPLAAMAQPSTPRKIDSLKNKEPFVSRSRLVPFSELDQRKNYHWGNGQTATPTGREAGEGTIEYVRLIGDDSAIVVKGTAKR